MGAGVGLVALTAFYSLGPTRVVATDGDVQVLEMLRANVTQNIVTNDNVSVSDDNGNNRRNPHGTVACPQLIWGHAPHIQHILQAYGRSHVVLAADTSYMSKSLVPLFQTARQCLHEDGVLIWVHVSYSQEGSVEALLKVGATQGFVWTRAASAPDVYVFRNTLS